MNWIKLFWPCVSQIHRRFFQFQGKIDSYNNTFSHISSTFSNSSPYNWLYDRFFFHLKKTQGQGKWFHINHLTLICESPQAMSVSWLCSVIGSICKTNILIAFIQGWGSSRTTVVAPIHSHWNGHVASFTKISSLWRSCHFWHLPPQRATKIFNKMATFMMFQCYSRLGHTINVPWLYLQPNYVFSTIHRFIKVILCQL